MKLFSTFYANGYGEKYEPTNMGRCIVMSNKLVRLENIITQTTRLGVDMVARAPWLLNGTQLG